MLKLANIVVGTDLSPDSDPAVEQAALLAARHGSHLHLVHARVLIEETYGLKELPQRADLQAAVDRAAASSLEKVRPRLEGRITRAVVPTPSAAAAIVEYATKHHADLIVVGTRGRGLSRMLVGSVAQTVVRRSPVSVLVVGRERNAGAVSPSRTGGAHAIAGPRQPGSYRDIVCGVDFSEESRTALGVATALAAEQGARLWVMHVVEHATYPLFYQGAVGMVLGGLPSLREAAEREMVAWLRQSGEAPAELVVAEGRAHRKLAQLAQEQQADLIVVGRTGLGRLERFLLGSVAERLLTVSPCPVWVVKPEVAPEDADFADAG